LDAYLLFVACTHHVISDTTDIGQFYGSGL